MQFSTSSQGGRVPYKWIVLMVVIFGSFMSILDQTVINNALPRLLSAFSVDLGSLQWVITAYTLTQGVVTPTTAFFANRLGTKRFYIIALVLFTLGSALCGLAWNEPSLIVFRVTQAIGGATLFPLAITLLFHEFPPHERGLATGILSISALLAPAVGPTLGGYLVTYTDWRLIFSINVPVGVVGVVMALLLLRERPSEGSHTLRSARLCAGRYRSYRSALRALQRQRLRLEFTGSAGDTHWRSLPARVVRGR